MDYLKAREDMVSTQIKHRGITDDLVLGALRKVPREIFVAEQDRERAYGDHPLPIGAKQTISQPFIVALMTQHLHLKGVEKVLEIGTGSGYQTAVLAEIANEVYSLDRSGSFVHNAERVLKSIGYNDVHIFVRDGTEGLRECAPYDRIIVTAGVPNVPPAFIEQLAEEGILVIPVGTLWSQELEVIQKNKGKVSTFKAGKCAFVPLVGKYGWHENEI